MAPQYCSNSNLNHYYFHYYYYLQGNTNKTDKCRIREDHYCQTKAGCGSTNSCRDKLLQSQRYNTSVNTLNNNVFYFRNWNCGLLINLLENFLHTIRTLILVALHVHVLCYCGVFRGDSEALPSPTTKCIFIKWRTCFSNHISGLGLLEYNSIITPPHKHTTRLNIFSYCCNFCDN